MAVRRRIRALAAWAIPPALPEAERWRALMVVHLSVVAATLLPVFTVAHAVAYRDTAITVATAVILGGLSANVALMRRTGSLEAPGIGILVFQLLPVLILSGRFGGLGSPAIVWIGFGVTLAALVGGPKVGLIGTLASVVAVLAFLADLGVQDPTPGVAVLDVAVAVNLILLATCSLVLVQMFLAAQAKTARAAREAKDRLQSLEQAAITQDRLASVGLLASGVAHEVNNPLTYLEANLELVRAELEGGRVPHLLEALDDAIEGSRRIAEIVRQLRTFAREEDDLTRVFDANDAVRAAVRTMRPQLGSARIELRLGATTLDVRGSEGRLTQVLVNLLSNALQAGPPDQTIILSARPWGPSHAALEVVDQGPGVPSELVHRIFDPFFTTKPLGQGTGLGLSVSHGLLEGMGGRLELAGPDGPGARFRVILPRAEASIPPTPRLSVAALRGSEARRDEFSPTRPTGRAGPR